MAAIPRWAVPTGELQLGLTQMTKQTASLFKLTEVMSPSLTLILLHRPSFFSSGLHRDAAHPPAALGSVKGKESK